MIVNFRVRGISRGIHKLTRTPTLIKKKKDEMIDFSKCNVFLCYYGLFYKMVWVKMSSFNIWING